MLVIALILVLGFAIAVAVEVLVPDRWRGVPAFITGALMATGIWLYILGTVEL